MGRLIKTTRYYRNGDSSAETANAFKIHSIKQKQKQEVPQIREAGNTQQRKNKHIALTSLKN